jgi:hypothetical protein
MRDLTAWWVRALVGLALAWGVVVAGFVGSGGLGSLDGPCESEAQQRDDVRGYDESSGWWPPETRCELQLAGGQVVVTRYPDRDTWWVAGAVLAAALILPAPLARLA